jgi:perosamine synthetase
MRSVDEKGIRFESRFSEYFESCNTISFWKVRVAFYAALKALGIGPRDEVILPGYTCVMNVNPIKHLGCKAGVCRH